jgi:phosphopantothenoylcysteine decarboxylase
VDLSRWADVCIIIPASANTIAKLANGICDNLLTCVCRCWNPKKPMYLAPAMNTLMWDHPLTRKHLDILENELSIHIIQPIVKKLACGEYGQGGLPDIPYIVTLLFKFHIFE